jgi:hypothetical protein
VPSLPDLFAIAIPLGALVGAVIGLFLPVDDDKDLAAKIALWAELGGLWGAAAAAAAWVGGALAGA